MEQAAAEILVGVNISGVEVEALQAATAAGRAANGGVANNAAIDT